MVFPVILRLLEGFAVWRSFACGVICSSGGLSSARGVPSGEENVLIELRGSAIARLRWARFPGGSLSQDELKRRDGEMLDLCVGFAKGKSKQGEDGLDRVD